MRKRTLWRGLGAVLIFIFCWFGLATADEPKSSSAETVETLSLEECIRQALTSWPGLEAALRDMEAAKAQLSEAKSAYLLPELKLRVLLGAVPDVPDGSGPAGNFPDVDTGLRDLGFFIKARVEAIQPVFTFGKLSNARKAAERGVAAKQSQQKVAQNEIIKRVKDTYYGLIFLINLRDFIEELARRAKKAQDKVEELLQKQSPEVTDIDLMRVKVFLAETDRRVVELNEGILLAQQTLGILTKGPGAGPVGPSTRVLKAQELKIRSAEYYLGRAKVARPEMNQLNDVVVIRRSLMNVSKADFFPQFFLGGFYEYAFAPDREDVSNPFLKDDFNVNTGGAAFGFEQKLGFHLSSSKYKKARAEYRKAQADRDQALRGIELEIRKAHSTALTKQASVELARRGFKAGRSWVTASTLNFGVGLVKVKEVLEALVAYSRVRTIYFNSIHDYQKALAELSRVVGEEVTEMKY